MWKLLLCVGLPLVRGHCYWNNRNPYPYFGTKTTYDAVRHDFRDVPAIEGCEPKSIWFMIRHGTRRPNMLDTHNMRATASVRDAIVENHAEGRGEMCSQDIDELQSWTWNPKLDYKVSYLTTHGYQELYEFGRRFGQKFSSFLEDVSVSVLRPTSEQRTQGSVKAFVQGLQVINRTFAIEDIILNDPVARPYRYCAKREAKVINSTKILLEVERFLGTKDFRKVQENVRRKTGIKKELKPNTILGMYDLCRFYRSYSLLTRSAWCAVFSDHDLEVLEYVEDLNHYFRNGYGKHVNERTGAAGLKDLYDKFLNATTSGQKSFTAYFTHNTMVHMIYTAMGLYEDYPKLSGYERVKERKWRTSFLTPFAANFVAVLYKCSKAAPPLTYGIQFFVNEREMHLCSHRLCSWADFQGIFRKFSNATLDFCDDLTSAYDV